MAKELLSEDDTILIESDLIFDSKILSKLIENPTKNLVLVEKHKPWMDGTVVKLDNDFTITHFVDKSQFDYSEISDYYKTVNMYKFSKDFLNNVYLPFFGSYSKVLGRNEYYEQSKRHCESKMKNLKRSY